MATAMEIARLITEGITGPTGGADAAWLTGTVLSWDETSQVNSVLVGQTAIPNMKTVQGGLGIQFNPGDTVMIVRKQTQYFIFGKITAPGGTNANLIKSATVNTRQATSSSSFVDLGTVGPSVNVNIGSSRRALVIANAGVETPPAVTGQYLGGWFTLAVTGASTLGPSGASTPFFAGGFVDWQADGIFTCSQTWLVTAADGLNQGLNTFRMMYATPTAGQNAFFSGRNISVIPF